MFLALLAATLAAPVPKAKAPPLYFPTTVGATWVYERDGGEEAVSVSAVEKDGDDLVVSRTSADKRGTKYSPVVVSADGLRQPRERADGQVGWVLKSTVRDGDSWEVPDGGTRTLHGPEEVQVPAGKYQALRVVWERDGETTTSWYAPGVGEVKRTVKRGKEEAVFRALKSFQAK